MANVYNMTQDLHEAEAMAKGLEQYVRGKELYGNTSGAFSSMPALTGGSLLLRLRRLDAMRDRMSDAQISTLDDTLAVFEQVRHDWERHYSDKLIAEGHSRADAIVYFYKECQDNMRGCRNNYPPEMTRRTIIAEIQDELVRITESSSELDDKVKHVDNLLRGLNQAADFQWDETLKPLYSHDEFWWLYQLPHEDKR